MKKLVFLAVLLVFVGSACAADITTGLVGWWKMDAPVDPANPRVITDSSGFGNDGWRGDWDTWVPGGGIDFDGGYWGVSGITFANNGADLIADMDLSTAVTVSYKATWQGLTNYEGRFDPSKGAQYTYFGANGTTRLLASESPTGTHMYIHNGNSGADVQYEAFNSGDSRFIFNQNGSGKTWGDMITITMTVDFTTGIYNQYIDGQLYMSATGKVGSFAGMTQFYLGRDPNTYSCMEGIMADFRIYNRALTSDDVAALVPEPATLVLLGLGGLTLIRRKRS